MIALLREGRNIVDVATISIIIAIIGCLVGVSGWIRTAKTDADHDGRENSEIKTSLDFIANDVKDLKVDVRAFNRDLQDVRTIAVSAESEAKRANDRIDRLNID